MNEAIYEALSSFLAFIRDIYSVLDREVDSQLEYELRDAIVIYCRNIEKVVKEAK